MLGTPISEWSLSKASSKKGGCGVLFSLLTNFLAAVFNSSYESAGPFFSS
jgi:hypothetical protein